MEQQKAFLSVCTADKEMCLLYLEYLCKYS